MKRVLFEKILVFLFVMSWVDFPRILYDKLSWDFMTAYHGKNLFPFLLPVILLFAIYTYSKSDFSIRNSNNYYNYLVTLIKRPITIDKLFIYLISYIIIINYVTAIIDQSEWNIRFVLPLISAHLFYFLYVRFVRVTSIRNIDTYFFKCIVFIIFIILFFQLLMFLGLIPGLTDQYSAEILDKIFSCIRVDGEHIGYTSYLGVILLYLMLFRGRKLSPYYCAAVYLALFFVLLINQTRGALLIAAIILFSYFVSLRSIRMLIVAFLAATLLMLFFWYLCGDPLGHRVFSYDSSAQARVYLMMQTGSWAFENNLLLGNGSYFSQNLRFGANQIVHSYYFRFLISYGFIGFFIFLYYYKCLFANKLSYVNMVGLFVVFAIYTFEPYLMWATYLIAIFSLIEHEKEP